MKKLLESPTYPDEELKRLVVLIDASKTSSGKKDELQRRVNILGHFHHFQMKAGGVSTPQQPETDKTVEEKKEL